MTRFNDIYMYRRYTVFMADGIQKKIGHMGLSS